MSLSALAQPAGAFEVEAEIALVSDYRFRGVSLSDEGPAVQGGVTASLAGGAYASVWASTIDEYGVGADGEGAQVELDYALGWAFAAGGYDVDLALSLYTYPGGHGVNYVEAPISVSRSRGDWTWTLGGAWAPKQSNLGDRSNTYAFGQLAWSAAHAPVSVAVGAGYEDGAFAPDGKWDWAASVSRGLGPVEAALTYVGVDDDHGLGALIASFKAVF